MCFAAYAQRFRDGGDFSLPFTAHMCAIDTAIVCGYLCHSNQCVSLGVVAWRIDQSGGESEGPLLHCLSHQAFHRLKLLRSRRPIRIAQNCLSNLRRAHIGANIQRCSCFLKSCEVSIQRGPVNFQVVVIEFGRESGESKRILGAIEAPSPVISVVIPCDSLLNARLSISSAISDCPSISTKPGQTTRPEASITRLALAPWNLPIPAIRSPWMAKSPETHGFPAPSIILPFLMITS